MNNHPEQYLVQSNVLFSESEDFFKTTMLFQQLLVAYNSAAECVTGALKIIEKEKKSKGLRSPIHSFTSRIKSPVSIQKKLHKQGLSYSIEAVVDNLNDVAGVRVICEYISDIYLVRNLLLSGELFTLVKEKDYIKNPKPNGYRSLHLIVEVMVHLTEGPKKVRCEIQLRTSAMDSWASLEHNMRYKKDLPENKRINNKLRKCAQALNNTDKEMQKIAEQLGILSQEYSGPDVIELLGSKTKQIEATYNE